MRLTTLVALAVLGLSTSGAFARAPGVIFFDWDGTIADNSENLSFAFRSAILEYGATKSDVDAVREHQERGDWDYGWSWAKKNFDEATLKQIEKRYLYLYGEISKLNYNLIPGSLDFLKEVRNRGIPAIVVSNRNGKAVRLEAGRAGLLRYFKGAYGRYDFGDIIKPNVEYLRLAGERSKVKYNSCWMIGDGKPDIDQGIVSGCKMFFVGDKAILDKDPKYGKLVRDGKIVHTDYEHILRTLISEPA